MVTHFLELQKHKWERGNAIECSMNTCARTCAEICDYDLTEKKYLNVFAAA